MRHIFVQSAVGLVLALSGAMLGTACFETATVGVENLVDGGADGAGGACKGENPGCCSADCSVKPPEATCAEGKWTCPSGDSLGPACPAICETDGGPPSSCTGPNPGCCTTDCGATGSAPEATCSAGKWTCPSGDSVGPVCPLICRTDAAPPPVCSGPNPGCCTTDCNGVPPPEATCSSSGAWTCPAGDTLGPACPAICEVDGGPPTCAAPEPSCCGLNAQGCEAPIATPTCTAGAWSCPAGDMLAAGCPKFCVEQDAGVGPCNGPAPSCCGLNADGCEGFVGNATCSSSGWTCPAGDTVGGACPTFCVAKDAGAPSFDGGPPPSCEGPAPSCCGLNSQGCEGPVGTATCSGNQWVCPAGGSPGGACPTFCVAQDGGFPDSGASCGGPPPSCCLPSPLCETLSVVASCNAGTWTCPNGATESEGVCACEPPTVDGGVGQGCGAPMPFCCVPAPLCETLSAAPSCSGGQWSCPSGAPASATPCACPVGGASPG
jgi:hypothetical protein